MNAVTAAAGRPVSFVSFTVPQDQREESYFAPLAGLAADPGTELNFALVRVGICTECGMGRVNRDEIPALLDLHREIIAAR